MNLDQLRQELLRPPKLLGVIAPFEGIRPQFQLHWVEQIGSTNQTLSALMAAGAPSGTVLMAATQHQGRGQWGRQWDSPRGGLYLSLGLKPELPVHRSAYLTLASAWGVATSLGNLGVPVQVKWPNDLVIGGKKLGGILTETRLVGQTVQDLVIGLGLNGFNPVPATGISLQQIIQPDGPKSPLNTLEGLAAVALYGLLQGYLYWQSQGDEAFLAAYQTRMAYLGHTVRVQGEEAKVVGVAASGNLRVQPCESLFQATDSFEIKPGEVTLGYNA